MSEGALTDSELRTLSATRLKRSHSLICSKGHKFEVLEKDLLVIPARHQMIVGENGDQVEALVNGRVSTRTFSLSKSEEIRYYMNNFLCPDDEIDNKLAQLRRTGATEFHVIDEPGIVRAGKRGTA